MHSQGPIGGTSSMEHETHLAHHEQSFGGDQWGDMSPYIQTTMADYGGGYGYMSSLSHAHGLPSEQLGRMPQQPPPGPQPSIHHHPHAHPHHPPPHHPPLPMLMVPSHPTWPSMLTNPGGFNASPPVAIPASGPVAALKASRPPVPPIASQPRKTLTDEDRRRMCQYHIDNPSMKQTEIGAMFGVERSTVSKVLSRKDKWLNPEDRSNSPIKKTKGKIPDIDKTLANWLRNEQHKGRHVSDAEIQEQARMYARPFREAETKINNPSWLEKFKQKHGMSGRLTRRASETNIPSAASSSRLSRSSPALGDSQPSSAISSASPVNPQSGSPYSGVRGDEDRENGMMDFNEPPSGGSGSSFKHGHTVDQVNTAMGGTFNSEAAGSFSEHTISPSSTGQFTFSPDPNLGGLMSSDHARHLAAGGPNFQRPRSQTFPTLDLEYMSQVAEGGHSQHGDHQPITPPKYPTVSTGPNSALDSPAHEFATAGPFGLDTAMSPHHQPSHHSLHHSSSASSLQGRAGQNSTTPVIGSAALSSVASSPVSPSQEDARRAADTLLSFIANSGPNAFVDQTDYNAVIRLTEKLRLHQQAQQQQASSVARSQAGLGAMGGMGMGMGMGLGGLDRIPEGDAEMGNTHMEGHGELIKNEETMAV